jgi:CHAT domain-containing protein
VYAGEGVVGLTQAFLVAGANGLSVSLWPVSDRSTMRFMTGLYALANEGMGYDRALTRMKREFIADERYNYPFFWAPFVYYGR